MKLIPEWFASLFESDFNPNEGVSNPQAQDLSGLSMSEFNDWVQGRVTAAGGIVTEQTALNIGAVYACVNIIAGAIASVPLNMYRRDLATGERERITPDEWWMLNEQPIAAWAAAPAWEYAAASLLLQGDSFWRIHRVGGYGSRNPAIAGFEPLHPRTVWVRKINERLLYQVSPQPSQAWETPRPSVVVLDQDDMLHVPGAGFNGLRGLSQVASVLAQPGGVALNADAYTNSFFANQARPDFVLKTDKSMTKDQQDALRQQWAEIHTGPAKAWKPAILTNGLAIEPITMPWDEAQMLETRKFQVVDIARIMGVPPHMIGATEVASSWGSGIEQMSIGFVKYTLQRHLVKFEQEINRKVFRTAARFCEFNTAGLERGDTKSRNESYRIGLGRAGEDAWLSVNEVRKMENLPPVPDGDRMKKATDSAPTTAKVSENA